MAYMVQNHAFDLVLHVTNDALLIIVDTNQRAICTHVPQQILKEDLQKLLPSSWITNRGDHFQFGLVLPLKKQPNWKKNRNQPKPNGFGSFFDAQNRKNLYANFLCSVSSSFTCITVTGSLLVNSITVWSMDYLTPTDLIEDVKQDSGLRD